MFGIEDSSTDKGLWHPNPLDLRTCPGLGMKSVQMCSSDEVTLLWGPC